MSWVSLTAITDQPRILAFTFRRAYREGCLGAYGVNRRYSELRGCIRGLRPMKYRTVLRRILAKAAVAVACVSPLVVSPPALAQACFTDSSQRTCGPNGMWVLQFRNSCTDTRTIQVCIIWSNGGTPSRPAATAGPGQIASITVGSCTGDTFQYLWQPSGVIPTCQ